MHIALVAAATALPPLAVLLGGGWAAVPVGAATGLVLGSWLGRRAEARLAGHQIAMLNTLAGAVT